MATLPVDVLTKPFSYCLPRHNSIPRKFLFSIGIVISFLWSVVFLLYPAENFTRVISICISAFFICTIFYWFGAWFVFRFRSWGNIVGLFVLVIYGGSLLGIDILIRRIVMQNALLVIVSGILANVAAFIYWGRAGIARRYCGRIWMGAFDAWDKEKLLKYKQTILAEKGDKAHIFVLPKVEKFFINRISQSGENLSRYIWGGLYKSFAVMLSCRNDWIRFIVVLLPILLVFGYMQQGGNIIFLMPAFAAVSLSLHTHSTLLISGGRRERFWTALILGTAAALLITAFVTFVALITSWLEPIMPVLTLKGQQFGFKMLNVNFFFLPLFMIPVALTVGLIFYGKPMIAMIIMMAVFQSVFIFLIIKPGKNQFMPGPTLIIIILLCSWAVFVSVLRYICMKCSLVK
ncbi:MAG: hypothetical protein WC496_05370 [Phycisphaerae bacterium]